MKNLLLFGRDPGGTNTLIPLVKPLQQKHHVHVYGKDFGLHRFKQENIQALPLPDKYHPLTTKSLQKFLIDTNIDGIITGTSADDDTEKLLWQAATSLSIPSIAIVDQWCNYLTRFTFTSVSDIGHVTLNSQEKICPSKICVMDDFAKIEMISLNFLEKIIEVTGQPYLEYIYHKSSDYPPVKEIKKSLGVSGSIFLLTYASEPITETYLTHNQTSLLGYTEESNLRHLLACLEEIDAPMIIIIKLHPKENPDKFRFLENAKFSYPIKIIKDFPAGHLIKASDLVCGMSSMFLIEALLMKKPVVSIQIGLTGTNPWIFDRQRICPSIRSVDELKHSLDLFIVGKKTTDYNMPIALGATQKIIDVIESQLWGS